MDDENKIELDLPSAEENEIQSNLIEVDLNKEMRASFLS